MQVIYPVTPARGIFPFILGRDKHFFQTENPAGEINGLYKIQESRYLMKAKNFLSNVVEIIPLFTVHILHI